MGGSMKRRRTISGQGRTYIGDHHRGQVRGTLLRQGTGKVMGDRRMGASRTGALARRVARRPGWYDGRMAKPGGVTRSSSAGDILHDSKTQGGDRSRVETIGLLPYIYRVWVARRRGQQQGWSLGIHDGKRAGAAALAARTRADLEVAKFQGKHTLLASLVCSKCYERAGHTPAGDSAANTGLQPGVANRAFDMDQRDRHVKAHGAVAPSHTGNHGLVAGCAFAKAIRKALIATMKADCSEGKPRDDVVDITLHVEGDTATECAARMHAQLENSRALWAGIIWRSMMANSKSWG